MSNLYRNLWRVHCLVSKDYRPSLFDKSLPRKLGNRFLHIRTVVKDRDVPTSRNNDPNRFLASLSFKILIEALSQQARITPDNIVFAWVVIGRAIKNLRTDTLLRNLTRVSHKLLLTDIQQKLLKQVRFAKAFAGSDPERQLPFLPQ